MESERRGDYAPGALYVVCSRGSKVGSREDDRLEKEGGRTTEPL